MQRVMSSGSFLLALLTLASVCGPSLAAPAPSPGALRLDAASYQVSEGVGILTVTVTRVGGSLGQVSANVRTLDITALEGKDYTRVFTTVTFAAGDTAPKTVILPILNDTVGEDPETFRVSLGPLMGGAVLGAPGTAVITINDNDAPPAPVLSATGMMKQLRMDWTSVPGTTEYRLLFRRHPVTVRTQVGPSHPASTTSTMLDIAVHRFSWAGARYTLSACNTYGCTPSDEIDVSGQMLATIGYFKASNAESADMFGGAISLYGSIRNSRGAIAVSADGNTLVVGAPEEDSDATGVNGDQASAAAAQSGAAYVFTRDAAGQWSQQAYLKPSNTPAVYFFGAAVALSDDGNTLAVGAPYECSTSTGVEGVQGDAVDHNGCIIAAYPPEGGRGAVYVFTRSGSQWSQQAFVKASNADRGDKFGDAVALSASGDTLAVGAWGEGSLFTGVNPPQANNSGDHVGAAYVFTRSNGQWSQEAYVKALNVRHGDHFGVSVALSDDGATLAVGARCETGKSLGVNGDASARYGGGCPGAAYVFARVGAQWSQQAYIKSSNTPVSPEFGSALALSGDGNTLAVGAPSERSTATGIGGDQQADEIHPCCYRRGAVYVFARSAAVWSQQAYVKASNTGDYDEFGWAVALSANGNTLAVGAPGEASSAAGIAGDQADDTQESSGAVYLFERNAGSWSQRAYVKAPNTGLADQFGSSVHLSGDGSTLAVAAPTEDSAATGIGGDQLADSAPNAGAVYLY
jgi:trimeric autotransporter adhesin